MAGDNMTVTNKFFNEIESLQLEVGSKIWPDYPISSHGESFYHLRKGLGIARNNLHV